MSDRKRRPMQWFKFDPTVVGTIVEDLDLAGQGAYFKLMRSLWVFGPLSEAEVRRKCGPTFEQLRELMCPVGECLSFAWLEALRSEGQHVSDVRAAAANVRHSKQKEASDEQLHANAMQLPSISKSSSRSQGRKERASENDERFESLWKIYEGKGAKGKAREYWAKLTEEDRGAILAKAPAYVASTSGADLAYRKNLEGWINPAERRWEAPIISRKVEAPKPKVWTKAEAIEEVRRIRDLHGKDFQTHHVPKDVLQAYRQTA